MSTPTTAQTAEGFLKSGFEHLEQQDYEKAMADFEAALKIMPDDTLAKSGIDTVRRRMNEEGGKRNVAIGKF